MLLSVLKYYIKYNIYVINNIIMFDLPLLFLIGFNCGNLYLHLLPFD